MTTRRTASKSSRTKSSHPHEETLSSPTGPCATGPTTIPLAHPDRSRPKTKTLLDIAAERNALLARGQPFSLIHGDGLARDENGRVVLPAKDSERDNSTNNITSNDNDESDVVIGPLGQAIFYTISLSMLHFTLSLLVAHQYGTASPSSLWPIARETAHTMPVLGVFVWLLKLPLTMPWRGRGGGGAGVSGGGRVKQVLHFVVGTAAGCYALWIGNRADYLAVMRRAAPVGTVWVWSVVEMRLEWAVASLALCAAYAWWNGFGVM